MRILLELKNKIKIHCNNNESRVLRHVLRHLGEMTELDYYITFPSLHPPASPNEHEELIERQCDQRDEFVFVYEDDKRPVVILLGWAGCQDRYLAKYSAIYEEKR